MNREFSEFWTFVLKRFQPQITQVGTVFLGLLNSLCVL